MPEAFIGKRRNDIRIITCTSLCAKVDQDQLFLSLLVRKTERAFAECVDLGLFAKGMYLAFPIKIACCPEPGRLYGCGANAKLV